MCSEREAGTYPAEANYQAAIDTILHRHTTNWHTAQNPTEKIIVLGLKASEDHQGFAPKNSNRKLLCSLQLLFGRGGWFIGYKLHICNSLLKFAYKIMNVNA